MNFKITFIFFFLSIIYIPHIKSQNAVINYDNASYPFGLKPTNIGTNDIKDSYISWKNNFVDANCSNNAARIKFDQPGFSVSEGIAYGMLLAAYANDKELLDGLWTYYKTHMNGNGVMNWKIEGCSTVVGQNGATDAELDAAIALIIAGNRFGNNSTFDYHQDARNLIAAMKQHEVEANTYVLKPGDAWGGSENTNPSYFAPGYFKVFGEFTNDSSFWNAVVDKTYQILNANLSVNNAVDCLVSDWCKADGSYSEIVPWAHEAGKTFYYDAGRTPWRIATDYLWYGDSRALNYVQKCENFVDSKGGIDQIKAGYKQDGTVIGNYTDPVFTGSFATALQSSSDQNKVNQAYTTLKSQTSTAYFAAILRNLYLYTMTGNLYNPLSSSALSIDEFLLDGNKIEIYTDISRNILTIDSSIKIDNAVIYDMSGKTVLINKIDSDVPEINIESLNTGSYILQVTSENNVASRKFVAY
ncbi:hypothetical protein GCM10022393_32570 [Aquimarina addita]|uniref:cellulase n=1 Tax=Aquimarina addita TaxID=870485 RepID=A0ABP6UT74_9FLAO